MKLLLVAVLCASFSHAYSNSEDKTYTLGRIDIVSDDASEASSNKIYSEEFNEVNKQDVASAAAMIPGVVLTSSGARNEKTIYVRGLDLRQVPLLVDGIPVYLPYDGYVDLGRFFLGDIAEIQATKGNTSALVGANALGGVLNIVTKKPSKPFEARARVGAEFDDLGFFQGGNVSANIGGKQDKYYYSVSGQFNDSDYLRASEDYNNSKKISNTYNQDQKLNLKFAVTPNENDEYSLNYINQKGEKGVQTYNGGVSSMKKRYWQYPEWDKQSLYWISKTTFNSSYIKTRAFYDELSNVLESYDDDSYSTMDDPWAFVSHYDDNSFGGNVEVGNAFDTFDLKGALHFKRDNHSEFNEGDSKQDFSDDTYSAGFESIFKITTDSKMIAGVSYNNRKSKDANEFDSNSNESFNPQLNYIQNLNDNIKINASVAYKTRFPTMKDRYSYKLGKAIPNPDLKEEQSLNYEIGGRLTTFLTEVGASIFHYDIKDTILNVNIDPSTTQMQNSSNSTISGLELDTRHELNPFVSIMANYTYIYKHSSSSDLYFVDSPEHVGIVASNFKLADEVSLNANVEMSSSRHSDSTGIRKVGGYTLMNTYFKYLVHKNIDINIGINNIFDADYQLTEGYPEHGRSYSVFGNMKF